MIDKTLKHILMSTEHQDLGLSPPVIPKRYDSMENIVAHHQKCAFLIYNNWAKSTLVSFKPTITDPSNKEITFKNICFEKLSSEQQGFLLTRINVVPVWLFYFNGKLHDYLVGCNQREFSEKVTNLRKLVSISKTYTVSEIEELIPQITVKRSCKCAISNEEN